MVKPEIVYMDEPFSALDALTNLKMRTELLSSPELQKLKDDILAELGL